MKTLIAASFVLALLLGGCKVTPRAEDCRQADASLEWLGQQDTDAMDSATYFEYSKVAEATYNLIAACADVPR